MGIIKKTFFSLLLLFGIGGKKQATVAASSKSGPAGTDGDIASDAAVIVKEERIVLVVDQDFEDIPSWVEWDIGLNKLSVAQMGGSTAALNSLVPLDELDRFKQLDRILLIARYQGQRIVHYLTFLTRE